MLMSHFTCRQKLHLSEPYSLAVRNLVDFVIPSVEYPPPCVFGHHRGVADTNSDNGRGCMVHGGCCEGDREADDGRGCGAGSIAEAGQETNDISYKVAENRL